MKHLRRAIALATFAALVYAQDISGDWQGALKAGPHVLRLILQVAMGDSGEWKAALLSIDQTLIEAQACLRHHSRWMAPASSS